MIILTTSICVVIDGDNLLFGYTVNYRYPSATDSA